MKNNFRKVLAILTVLVCLIPIAVSAESGDEAIMTKERFEQLEAVLKQQVSKLGLKSGKGRITGGGTKGAVAKDKLLSLGSDASLNIPTRFILEKSSANAFTFSCPVFDAVMSVYLNEWKLAKDQAQFIGNLNKFTPKYQVINGVDVYSGSYVSGEFNCLFYTFSSDTNSIVIYIDCATVYSGLLTEISNMMSSVWVEDISSDHPQTRTDVDGSWGNLYWVYDLKGSLQIAGTGAMDGFGSSDNSAWREYAGEITRADIGEGITSIGNNAFRKCGSLTKAVLPNTLTRIGNYAFYNCSDLQQIAIPDGVISIGNLAFYGCDAITEVEIPDSVTSIGSVAFSENTVICCSQGSYAETWAEENDYSVRIIKREVQVTNIYLNPDQLTLTITDDEEYPYKTLVPEILPDNATDPTVSWTSNKDEIAAVNRNGKVTAISEGTAFITCEANDGSGVCAVCEVTVVDARKPKIIYVDAIVLKPARMTLIRTAEEPNPSDTITAQVFPEDATDPSVSWETSDEDVAVVNGNGKVIAIGEGTAVITCTANDGSGISETCTVTVLDETVPTLTLNKKSATLTRKSTKKNPSVTLTATVTPETADTPYLIWESSNDKVATVSSKGKVTALTPGTTEITCTLKDNSKVTATCIVTVKDAKVTSFTVVKKGTTKNLKGTTVKLKKGKSMTLAILNLKPTYAMKQGVTYKSGDKNIATVSSKGVIKALKKGTVQITVQSKDKNKKITFWVQVTK